MADEGPAEDYPTEIEEYLTGFEFSLSSVRNAIQTLMDVSKSDHLQLDPLEQAKLDLMSAYTINSLFWMYLVTQGVNPKEHGIKQELERIRTYMNRVKETADKKKAARLDKGAASRFVRNALWDAEEAKGERGTEHPGKAKDSPKQPWKAKDSPKQPWKAKDSPKQPWKAKDSPQQPWKAKDSPQQPKKPRKAKDSPQQPRKAKQRKLN